MARPSTPRLVYLVLVILTGFSAAQDSRPPDCLEEPNHQLRGFFQLKGIDFIWVSEWRQNTSLIYHFYRQVINNSNKPLYYEWPVAEIPLHALARHSSDSSCTPGFTYRQPPNDGLLYYGRDGRRNIPTYVWKPPGELNKTELDQSFSPRIKFAAFLPLSNGNETSQPGLSKRSCEPLTSTYHFHVAALRRRKFILFIPLPRRTEEIDTHLVFESSCELASDGVWRVRDQVRNENTKQYLALSWVSVFPPDQPRDKFDLPTKGTSDPFFQIHYSDENIFLQGLKGLWHLIWPSKDKSLNLPSPFDNGPTFTRTLVSKTPPARETGKAFLHSSTTGDTVLIIRVPEWAPQ